MGLLDDLKTPPPVVLPCKVRTIAANLEPADAKIFLDAVKNPAWKVENLSDALRAKDILISSNRLKNHRRGTCSCSKI